jgi:ribosomal protein S18 acetylase RimI-like enzyme
VDDATAEIRRMWIGPAWRGLGLGRRLLGHLETTAGGLGYRHVVLDTNQTLREAIALYEAAGYHSIERYNDNPYAQRWFAKELVSRAGRKRSAPAAAAR